MLRADKSAFKTDNFKTSLASFLYEKRLRRYFSSKMKVEMGRGTIMNEKSG